MVLKVFNDKSSLGKAAARKAAATIRSAIRDRSHARVIAATGTSQFEFLAALTEFTDVDWSRVEVFHLDEYIGLPVTHPASFRKILLDRLVNKAGIAKFHPLDGDARDVSDVIRQVGQALASAPVDIAFVGIGENGHLAFNDPPADFNTESPTWSSTLMKPAAGNRWGKAGSATYHTCPSRQSRCQSVRS